MPDMKFTSYASSSHGNLYTVDDGETKIILECGVAFKTLQKLIGFSLSEYAGCLVSHEHGDHAKCVKEMISRGVKVYLSEGTAEATGTDRAVIVGHNEKFSIGTYDVVPFNTFHDCPEPLGYLIQSRVDHDILVFATDTVNLRYNFPGVSILAVEANYDKDILAKCEKLPDKVRHRITNTHMEIGTLVEYLKRLDLSKCREIYLLHLSDATSNEFQFIKRVQDVVPNWVTVKACARGGK